MHPILDDFLELHPAVSVRLLLLDRFVNLVDEGVDIALAHRPSRRIHRIISTRLGGDVRRVVVASPRYLATHPRVEEPADLTKHQIVAFTNFGLEARGASRRRQGSSIPRTVQFTPRCIVNSVRAAVASALAGRGLTQALFLSCCRLCEGRPADDRARRCRAPSAAGSSSRTTGPHVRPEGPRLCRFRHAASALGVCTLGNAGRYARLIMPIFRMSVDPNDRQFSRRPDGSKSIAPTPRAKGEAQTKRPLQSKKDPQSMNNRTESRHHHRRITRDWR